MSQPKSSDDTSQRTNCLLRAIVHTPIKIHPNSDFQLLGRRQSRLYALVLASATVLLGACASQPPTPDWQANAFAALKGFSVAYLSGNSRLAETELARTKSEIARTGRATLMARAELTRCAVRVASLEFDGCASYQPLAPDASLQEQAYAAFLTGQWAQLNPELLPPHYQALVTRSATLANAATAQVPISSMAPTTSSQLTTLPDPLARLVAAGVLLQTRRLSPADIEVAVDTAANQGWRRPLLAWLGVQRQRADAAGDAAASARLQRRIDLVFGGGSNLNF